MAALADVVLLLVSLTESAAMAEGTFAADEDATLGFGGGGGGGASIGGCFGGGGGALMAAVDADVTELTDVILFS